MSTSDMAEEFEATIASLLRGDFSFLDPVFATEPNKILSWLEQGRFENEPIALGEALACACFNGRTKVAEKLLERVVENDAGNLTGMGPFHWAANRGQLETVKMLIAHKMPIEAENSYGGTVLSCAVWSYFNENKRDHLKIIECLLEAKADPDRVDFPTGDALVDDLLAK